MLIRKFWLTTFVLIISSTLFGQSPTKEPRQKISAEDSRIMEYVKRNDFTEMKAFLTEKKLEEPIKKARRESAILLTAEYGAVEMMRFLSEDLRLNINIKGPFGHTPVHRAARAGNKDMVQFLIEDEGLDPKANASHELTPLHWATGNDKNLETVRYLVEEAHVDADIKDDMGRTPLERAAAWGCVDIFEYLVEKAGANYKDESVLTEARKPGNTAILNFINQKLAEKGGAKESTRTKDKRELGAVLLKAIEEGNLDTVKELAEEKALDFNKVRTADDYSVLQYAIQCGQLSVVRYLFENHHPDKTFVWGSQKPNALQWAALRGKTEIVRYLIQEQNFDPDENDNQGSDAFCYATSAKIRNIETIDLLIKDYRANVEKKDGSGQTALMRAISYGNLSTVKYLIEEAHANTSTRDGFGQNIYQASAGVVTGPEVLKYLVTNLKPDPEKDIGKDIIAKAATPATREYLETLFR